MYIFLDTIQNLRKYSLLSTRNWSMAYVIYNLSLVIHTDNESCTSIFFNGSS